MRLRWYHLLIVFLPMLALLINSPAHHAQAQEPDSCQALVEAVYTALIDDCNTLDRNEACVAAGPVLVAGETEAHLAAGDIFDLTPLHTLTAGPLKVDAGEWGALAIAQGAGLPSNTPGLVTMWLLGGAELVDARTSQQRDAPPTATCYANIVTEELNVRNYPGSSGVVLDVLQKGDKVIITGRLADSSWWRVDYPDPDQAAWVFSGYARTNCPIVEIPTVLRNALALSAADWYRDPFQIAVLRPADEASPCPGAPPPGLLLQPPTSGQSRFALNGVTFDLDATLYVQASIESGLLFQVIEDTIVFTVPDGTPPGAVITAPPGSQLRIPLLANDMAAGQAFLEPLDVDELAALPLDRLPYPLTGLPRPVIRVPEQAENLISARLSPDEPVTLFFDNRAGVAYDINFVSDAFPMFSIFSPDGDVVRPFINQGRLRFSYWPVDDRPYIIELAAGSNRSGTYNLSASVQDTRLCVPGGNSQSRTLLGGEDHAGNLWFGRAGDVVTLTASGDISPTASMIPDWRLRTASTFLENATLPPIVFEQLAGFNADSITWEVPSTGYYWIEVWTAASGTTTVTSTCE